MTASFKPHKITPPTGKQIGYHCDCGLKFPSRAMADNHMREVAEEMLKPGDKITLKQTNDEPQEIVVGIEPDGMPIVSDGNNERRLDKEKPVAEPKNELANVKAGKLDMGMAQKMVLKYSTSLVENKRAQQFMAQFMLIQRNNPKLASVDPQSLLSSMMACVHLDLMPNTPEQYAHIIPYGNQASFQVGYRGLVELAYRTGTISSINAELVFEGDDFDVMLGTERGLRHRPSFDHDRTDYTKVTHAYATAILKDGSTVFEVLSRKELDKVQKTAEASTGDVPWVKWPESMAKKTAVKRLTKLLPGSTEDNRLKMAAEIDSLAEVGKLKYVDGELVSENSHEVPEHVRQAISNAETRDELDQILQQLPVAERKNAAQLAQARVKEIV